MNFKRLKAVNPNNNKTELLLESGVALFTSDEGLALSGNNRLRVYVDQLYKTEFYDVRLVSITDYMHLVGYSKNKRFDIFIWS